MSPFSLQRQNLCLLIFIFIIVWKVVRYMYLECVPFMFVGGADTELVNNIGRRPIHIASDSESLQLLLDHGARVDAQVRRGDCYSFKLMLILNEFQFMVIRIESETLPSTLPFCPRTATVWTFC